MKGRSISLKIQCTSQLDQCRQPWTALDSPNIFKGPPKYLPTDRPKWPKTVSERLWRRSVSVCDRLKSGFRKCWFNYQVRAIIFREITRLFWNSKYHNQKGGRTLAPNSRTHDGHSHYRREGEFLKKCRGWGGGTTWHDITANQSQPTWHHQTTNHNPGVIITNHITGPCDTMLAVSLGRW